MLFFKFNGDGVNFLLLDFQETLLLTISLAVIIIAVVAALVLKARSQDLFAKYMAIVPWVIFGIAVALIAYCVVADLGTFSESYQLWLLVALFVAVVVAIVLNNLYNKNNNKLFRIIPWCLLGVVGALLVFNVVGQIEELSSEYKLWVYAGIFVLLASGALISVVAVDKSQHTARSMAIAGMSIAICFALSYIRLFKLPQGGSITLASVALIALYSYMFGAGRGVLVGLVYGVLQSIQDPWILNPVQYLLDYPIAFGMFGLVGIFRGKLGKPQLELLIGFVIAVVGRYISHFFSGSIFFGAYGMDFGITNPWAWGALYNLFVFADGIIAYVVASRLLASRSIKQMMLEEAQV